MKKIFVCSLIIGSVFLSGCQSKKPTSQTDSSNKSEASSSTKSSLVETSSTSTESSTVSSSTQMIESGALWSPAKAQKLNEFVINWGQTLGQTYKEYSPTNNVDLYGLQLPAIVLNNQDGWQATIGEVPIKLAWSDNGEGENALVAVFSDAETQPYLEQHVYFFTIVSGVPKVLVTTQNQGNEHNYLYFNESENMELNEGFTAIVKGN